VNIVASNVVHHCHSDTAKKANNSFIKNLVVTAGRKNIAKSRAAEQLHKKNLII
jgi:hypothetical protein